MADLTAHVHAALSKHYPPHVLRWVKRASWRRDGAVPLSRIDMSRRPGGRDPKKVAGIAQAVKDGKPMPPVVLVDTGEGKFAVADGYHRTLGFAHAGKNAIPALIASGVGETGPWEERMHAAKLNLTAAAAHVHDLAGVCTGPGPCDTKPFGAGKNWVNSVGGLPEYIRAVAHAFRRKGLDESAAIERAVGVVRNWAEGKGNVTTATRARAAAAIAEWERKKAQAHALTAEPARTVDLTDTTTVAATTDGPSLTYPVETAAIRQRAKTATFPHKFLAAKWTHPNGHPRCAKCGQEERTGGVCTKPDSKPTAGPATSIPLTAGPAVTVDLAWNAALHPRGAKGASNGGKFVAKNSAAGPPSNMVGNVRDFQRRNGLPVTGVIDRTTAAKIRALTTPKTGGGGRKKKSSAKAKATAQPKAIAQHVATVNVMTPSQRAAARRRLPVPPTGYVWTPDNTLRRYHP